LRGGGRLQPHYEKSYRSKYDDANGAYQYLPLPLLGLQVWARDIHRHLLMHAGDQNQSPALLHEFGHFAIMHTYAGGFRFVQF
jgi:hypothetical protein